MGADGHTTAPPQSGEDPGADPTEETLLGYFDELSNWGRFGASDEQGTLNHLTPERRVDAARLVREGRVVGCGRSITAKSDRPGSPVLHLMMSDGADAPDDGASSTVDWLGIGWHGVTVTHLDAHSHMLWRRRMYGGRDASAVTARHGATAGGVDAAGDGIAGRGVLLDVAGRRGRPVAPGESVGPDELDRCAEAAGVRLEAGDLVLVRFGRSETGTAASLDDEAGLPGLGARCLPWLHEHRVAVLGTDYVADATPSPYERLGLPVHTVGIVAMGLWIVDNLELERLGAECREARRWEFFFTVSPLRIARGTGSPVNPMAVL